MSLKLRRSEVVHSKHRQTPPLRAPPVGGLTLQVLHSRIQAFTLQQPRQSRAFTLQALHSRIQAFTLQQPRQPEALHYKLYTAGYRLLHYNSPASRGLLHYKLYTAGYRPLHYNRPASRGPLHYKLLYLHHTHNTKRDVNSRPKHNNEELPLSSKLGQVSAMSSITSYVKDSLSKLNSTQLDFQKFRFKVHL
ncbi:hypothetical protein KY285_011392 [Solanum tuberosum]|nr:hypothetical protein KY285_011392 [Solanum tuberosum]